MYLFDVPLLYKDLVIYVGILRIILKFSESVQTDLINCR